MKQKINTTTSSVSSIDCLYRLKKRYKYNDAFPHLTNNGGDINNNNKTEVCISSSPPHLSIHPQSNTSYEYDKQNLLTDESICRLFTSLEKEVNAYKTLPHQEDNRGNDIENGEEISDNLSSYDEEDEDDLLSNEFIYDLFDSLYQEANDASTSLLEKDSSDTTSPVNGDIDNVDNDAEDELFSLCENMVVLRDKIKVCNTADEVAVARQRMVLLKNKFQLLFQNVEQPSATAGNGSTSSGREPGLKGVRPAVEKYINDQNIDINTQGNIYNLVKDGHLNELRKLIKDEHAELKPDHRFAIKLMNDSQLYRYLYRFTSKYKESRKNQKTNNDAKKKGIRYKILQSLRMNAPFIEPESEEAAYVIQCIFNYGRLHHNTAVATQKMLTSILVQIQEFGEKGEDFLKSWGVKPLTEEFIESFKADKENWPYLQGGYYVGLTSTVEYMDPQNDGVAHTYGAYETVSQITRNLGLGGQCTRVVAMGAISDSMFICLCRRSASTIESSMQTFFQGMYILAPKNTIRPDEVCVVSLQKVHDAGSTEDAKGDGDGTQAHGVFLTCVPGHSIRTNVKNDGIFTLSSKPFVPKTPVAVSGDVQKPQGFGLGGTSILGTDIPLVI